MTTPVKWCIVDNNNLILNIIVSNSEFANVIGAKPWYEDATIGELYNYIEPEPEPEPPTEMEQLRADVDYLLMMQEG